MAARKNLTHTQLTRDRIQTSMLVNRLTQLVEGKVEMPPHAVTAALGLLKKALPDLQSIQHSGDEENPLAFTSLERKIVHP